MFLNQSAVISNWYSMDIAFHIVLPLLVLKLFKVESKWIYLLLPLTILMDLGRFVGLRKELNSIFFVLVALFLIYIFVRRLQNRNLILGISAFYLFSHLLLDLGYYNPLFWPFIKTFYWIKAEIVLYGLLPVLNFSIETANALPMAPGTGENLGVVVSTLGFALLAILLLPVIIKKFWRH